MFEIVHREEFSRDFHRQLHQTYSHRHARWFNDLLSSLISFCFNVFCWLDSFARGENEQLASFWFWFCKFIQDFELMRFINYLNSLIHIKAAPLNDVCFFHSEMSKYRDTRAFFSSLFKARSNYSTTSLNKYLALSNGIEYHFSLAQRFLHFNYVILFKLFVCFVFFTYLDTCEKWDYCPLSVDSKVSFNSSSHWIIFVECLPLKFIPICNIFAYNESLRRN